MTPVAPVAVSIFGAPLSSTQASGSAGGQMATTALQGAAQGLTATSATNTTPFGDLLVESVGQVDQLERQARSSVEGLISGKGVDVHEAMIATEKADMGFELMLSVRNKALAAYQQVMGMQF